LARDGIINAGTLTSLEKGMHWPKASTLRKLEEVLAWTPGTISALRHGEDSAAGDPADATVALTGTIAAAHMTEASNLALEAMRGRIALLPDPADPAFAGTVGDILEELRRLEALTNRVARNAGGVPAVAVALGAIRSTYRDLVLTAARSPHATLGQRLFAARYRSGLSEDEAANAAGITREAITNAEAEQPISSPDATTIETLLVALS
jgi:transcriptional regulator with XRE-family HTH domain